MTGDELRSWRQEHGVSIEEAAAVMGMTPDEVRDLEDQRDVARRTGRLFKLGIWEAHRDRLMTEAGIPTCAWLEGGQRSLQEIGRHSEGCSICQRRLAFVEESVPAPPAPPGLFAGILHFGNNLAGWKKSAFAGGMLLVYMAGIAAPIILVVGLIRGDVLFALGAFAFLALLFVSGAVGGIVHYLTTALRRSSRVGYYLSWGLTVYAYLVTIGAVFYVVELLTGAAEHEFDLREPETWVILGVMGLLFGAVVGYAARDRSGAAVDPSGNGVTGV